MSKKVKVTICHVIELYKQKSDGRQVYQIKMKTPDLDDALGKKEGRYYYIKLLDPKVKEGDVVTIDLDAYDTYKEEFKPKDEDKVIVLTYLTQKQA